MAERNPQKGRRKARRWRDARAGQARAWRGIFDALEAHGGPYPATRCETRVRVRWGGRSAGVHRCPLEGTGRVGGQWRCELHGGPGVGGGPGRCAFEGNRCTRRGVRRIGGLWWCADHVAHGRRELAASRKGRARE